MNEFIAALRQILLSVRLWFTVAPWEQALRVRLGRHVKLLGAGVHFRIPLVDLIYLQSVRKRLCSLPRQTVFTLDQRTIALVASVGYEIADIEKLYRTLHHPEDTIANLTQAAIVNYVSTRVFTDCAPKILQDEISKRLDLAEYGLASVELFVMEFAVVRAYRLLNESTNYGWGARLDTNETHRRSSI